MSQLEPRGVFRPTTCTICRASFYTDTVWDHGQLVYLDDQCPGCSGQATLFGGAE